MLPLPVPQVRTGVMMVQSEGWAALMSGTSATVARGLFYGGARATPPSRPSQRPCLCHPLWLPCHPSCTHCIAVEDSVLEDL